MDQAVNKNSLRAVICSCLLMLVFSHVHAQNNVVVVPLFSDAEASSDIGNVVIVAKSGGDFSNPVAAMNSINDASSDNRYLIAIGPGTYSITETLVAKPYVSILGSGQSSTIIRVGSNNISTTLETASYGSTTISNLTIQNIAGNRPFCLGIDDFSSGGTRLTQLTINASGCSGRNAGIYSSFGASIDNVTITASGGTRATGIDFYNAFDTIENLNVRARGGSLSNTGISVTYDDLPPGGMTILDSSISVASSIHSVTASTEVIGVDIRTVGLGEEFSTHLVNSIVDTNGIGASINADRNNVVNVNIRTSSITGEEASLEGDADSTFVVSSSSLIGGVSGAGVKKCANSDNGEGEELTSACLEN